MTSAENPGDARSGGNKPQLAFARPIPDERVADHIISRIDGGNLATDPFEYAIVSDAFPDVFFRQIEAVFPSPDDGRDHGLIEVRNRRVQQSDRYSDRRLVLNPSTLSPEQFSALPPALHQLVRVMANKRVSAAMIGRFRTTVKRRTAEFLRRAGHEPGAFQVPLANGLELIFDQTGFALPPHTDGSMKLVTALIYFPRPGDPEDMGTHLYQAVDHASLRADKKAGQRSLSSREVVHCGFAPYRPNLMFLFARTDRSLHGVPHTASINPRRVVQFSITFTQPCNLREMSTQAPERT